MKFNEPEANKSFFDFASNLQCWLLWSKECWYWIFNEWKKVLVSDDSYFFLMMLIVVFRVLRKQHQVKDPSCTMVTVPVGSGGITIWKVFSWYTHGLLFPVETFHDSKSLTLHFCWTRAPVYVHFVFWWSWYFCQENSQYHWTRILSDWCEEHDSKF